MGKVANDELRKIRNEHFMKAFKYVAKCLNKTQGALAAAIGSRNSYISNFSNGTRPIPDETIDALVNFSAEKGVGIFKEYLLGNSEIMLLANVTEEERKEVEIRKNNPDYFEMKKRKHYEYENEASPTPAYDFSFMFEKIIERELSMSKKIISSLERNLADKDKIIASKDEIIANLKDHIRHLESSIANERLNDFERFPFKIGVAESLKDNK